MNPAFFQQLETILAPERLGAYQQDGATPATTLARYLLNMALCEALYSPLQFAEVLFRLSAEHLAALQAGQTLALDVQNEYIAFLISAEPAKLESAIQLSAKELAGIRSQPVIASDPREIGFHAKPGNEAQPKWSKK